MDQTRPEHAAALQSANVIAKFPALQQVLDQDEAGRAKKANEETKKKTDKRNVFFVVAFSRFWKMPARKIITRLLKKTTLAGSGQGWPANDTLTCEKSSMQTLPVN